MTQVSVAERLGLGRLLAAEGARRSRGVLGYPSRLLATARARAPDRLLIAPQDIRTADATIAIDIYAGYFAFAGKMVNTHGRAPFELPPPSPAWATALASFGWLRHLRAADTALARANARALVADWMSLCDRRFDAAGWEPRIAARRLLSWLSQSPLILDGADRGFYRRFMKCIGRHGALLQRALREGLAGDARLTAVIALAELGLCAEGLAKLQRRSTRLLADELTRQILPDGGHITRNPSAIVELLLDLLPLRQAYAARGLNAPPQLLNSIDRMLPMLRLFRLGDGTLALFNGMGVTAPDQLATILAHDDARAVAMLNAPYSGYQRLETWGSVLVMDTGPPPPPAFSERAHAGCLSFEFSTQGQRLVVNCGAPIETRAASWEAARTTAAHSTVVISDTSSCRFAAGPGLGRWIEGRIISGPRVVNVRRDSDGDAQGIAASHDGYQPRFGIVHERAISVAGDGGRLEGWDRLVSSTTEPATPVDYAIRFHLHPGVRATRIEGDDVAELLLPDGATWLFRADGLPIDIEESIYFAGPERARGAEQLVIHANTRDLPGVHWIFERREARE